MSRCLVDFREVALITKTPAFTVGIEAYFEGPHNEDPCHRLEAVSSNSPCVPGWLASNAIPDVQKLQGKIITDIIDLIAQRHASNNGIVNGKTLHTGK